MTLNEEILWKLKKSIGKTNLLDLFDNENNVVKDILKVSNRDTAGTDPGGMETQ